MSEGPSPEPAAAIAAAAEDSEATASEGSHHDVGAITVLPINTATGAGKHARGQNMSKAEHVADLPRSAEAASTADHPTNTSAAAHVITAPGVFWLPAPALERYNPTSTPMDILQSHPHQWTLSLRVSRCCFCEAI